MTMKMVKMMKTAPLMMTMVITIMMMMMIMKTGCCAVLSGESEQGA